MILFFFFPLRPQQSGYSRDMKKLSLIGCFIDKRQKSRGTVKIRFTGLSSGLHDGQPKPSTT